MPDPPYRAPAGPPRCPCGHAPAHHMVSAIGSYTILGWFLLVLGVTAPMTRLTFKCRVCEQIIATTTDPKAIEAHQQGSPWLAS